MTDLKEKARLLPLQPGVYIMKDRAGGVIYVGKAKQLKNRVSQYFQEGPQAPKTAVMVSQVEDFDVILADSEFEALVLEASLIKRHLPKYNILLKDDKGYPFIRLTEGEEYPRFSMAAKQAEDGARYFGPYGGRNDTQAAIHAVCNALKLPTCSRKFPRDIGKERPCLNFHMGRCDGYCRPGMSREEYRSKIGQAILLLEGKFEHVTSEIKAEMEAAAEELRFERAAELRDRIQAIELLGKKQKVIRSSRPDTDAAGYYRGEAKSCLVILHFAGGELVSKDVMLFGEPGDEAPEEAVAAVVKQYYLPRDVFPRQILLPCAMEDMEPFARALGERAGRKVSVEAPKRGEKAELVGMAARNAEEEAQRAATREEKVSGLLEALRKMLGMEARPERIEAFDISNTGGADIVGSMAVFEGGRPRKRDYRRFKIKGTQTPDDYYSMGEVLSRRLNKLSEKDEKFSERPDLILVDGGQEHARIARSALEAGGFAIPVFGMVKDDRHRTRALVSPEGKEIGIQANPGVFSLIGRIQEEAHRFAIEYHRNLRSRGSGRSVLDKIPGIGPERKKLLLREFKSLRAIRAATEEELSAAVPKDAARAVYQYFHGEEKKEP
ncbi:excinuclease ABC subunit UvrC [Papillibacter cinnamivorans]|uniref:UvrABC system protein C n=1 Tax=Papillibacter cinnamivorans DSM 12816 TaxID=1122930 RepID=A0A1W1YZR7_9FIRM|nr:excinuclease ABC subunit UvrC [Papillibacter cinnamivorans]SMC41634.1 Excinuclease ABC subunit C [Papillibacter cinnamivorans DSM 12816]